MDDLISRQAAIDALTEANLKSHMDSVEVGQENRSAIRIIMELPSVEQKRGEWIWSPKDIDGTVSGCCSNCSFSHLFIGGHTAQYNYCPNCGADMRGKDDEQIH